MAPKTIIASSVSVLALLAANQAGAQEALGTPAASPGATQATTPQTRNDPGVADAATPESAAPAASEAGPDDIVVTGVRASLASAAQIKRNASAVVDSIVAEDIGKLPDNTVSDALQRVTGVQVARSAGEASSVQLRGLPDVETYINGRETFTGTGRGVALADIPAELVAGIDVYKTLNPEQIEGAIAGAVDIRLRRPFDFPGFQLAGGARGLYGDQVDKWSYVASGLVSNRWETSGGQQFGVLIGASYNRRRYNDQIGFNFGFNCPKVGTVCTPDPGNASAGQNLLIPDTVGGQDVKGDRRRIGGNISLQWKPTPDLEFYVDGLYTQYKNDYDIDFFVGLPKAGLVTAATAQPGSDVDETGNPVAGAITTVNNFTISSKQTYTQKTDNYQANGGARYSAGPATLSTELTYNKSKVRSQQFVLDTFYVVPRIDYNFNDGGTPTINFNGFDYRDPSILTLSTLFDNANSADSEQYAWRNDVAYDVSDSGFIRNFKVGTRYAYRKGDSGGTNGNGFPLGNLPGSQFPGFSTNSGDDILDGKLGVNGFALASSDFLRDNIVELRGFAGLPESGHAYDPGLVFRLKERNYAVYGQVGYGLDLGSVPITGVAGLRVVNTVTSLNASQTSVGPTGVLTVTPISGRSNQLDLLPSATLKAQLRDDLILRLVGSKSVLRPQFAQLNPATSLTALGVTGGTFGSGSGGNPNLRFVKSDNADATLEWYFSNTGSLTAGVFYKRLDGYIVGVANVETYPNTLGQSVGYLVSRPVNAGKGTLKGAEVGYQQFFDFLPGPLSGFGAQANFTLAEGKVPIPDIAGNLVQGDIPGTSKYSYNLIGIYEKYGFSARLAYNWRSSYTDSYSTAYAGGRIVVAEIGYLDFSASYALNDAITLTFDATNLTNATYQDSFGTNGFTPRDTRQYDRTFGGGVRFKF